MQALTARQVIFRIILIISFAELLIMLVLGLLDRSMDIYTEAILDTVILVMIAAPAIYIWVIRPFIRARDEALESISQIAFTDHLTQIANRRQILQLLEMSIASCKRHNYYGALLLIDLNKFKPVNDTYGHGAGDALLVEVALRLRKLIREEDTVGRLGGDEFVILLPQLVADKQISINEVGQITQRIITSLKNPMEFKGNQLHISVSIGIRLIDASIPDVETVISQADYAMYQAKQENKDFAVSFFNTNENMA